MAVVKLIQGLLLWQEKEQKLSFAVASNRQTREANDWAVVKTFFSEKFGTELPDCPHEAIEIVHDTVEHYPSQLGLLEVQVHRILSKTGYQKIAAVSGAIRTLRFMERYR